MAFDPTEDPLYGVGQVASMFDVKPFTVRAWIKEGRVKSIKVMGQWRIPKSELIRLANEEHG